MTDPTRNWHPPTVRSWSYRDILAYLRGRAAEGVRWRDGDPNAAAMREWVIGATLSASPRERREMSDLLLQLNLAQPQQAQRVQQPQLQQAKGTNGQTGAVQAAPPTTATAITTPTPTTSTPTTPPLVERDPTQRRLTPAQAERELLPIIYEGGWFGHLAHYTQRSQSPPAYFFGAALTIAAAAFAARPRIVWEQSPLYTNLYTVLVGESGAGKSTAVEWVQAVMQPALGNYLLGNDGTPQGFMRSLHERWATTRLCADGLIIADEYKNLIGREKHKEQLVTFLTAVYGKHGPHDRTLGGDDTGKYYFENPRVSIIAATTMEFWRSSHEDAVLGGYVPRHFIFQSVADEWTNDMNAPLGMAEAHAGVHPLTRALRNIIVTLPNEITLAPDAWDYVNHWRNNDVRRIYEAEHDREIRAWLRRKPTGVLKVATICHLINRHPGPVCVACAHWARRVVDWQDYGVRRVYNDLSKNRLSRLTQKITAAVEKAGATGITTGALRKGLRHTVKRKEVEEICGDLAKEGVVWGMFDPGNDTIWRIK